MFIRYVKDMKSWILFFGISLGFTNLLIWLDKGMHMKPESLLYLNVLLLATLIVFFSWRYKKETKYSTSLSILMNSKAEDWHEALPDFSYSRDQVTNELLLHIVDEYKKEIADLRASHISESDYTASWVHEVKAPLTAMKMMIDTHTPDPAMRKLEAEWLRVHLLIDRQLYISRLPTLEADYILDNVILQELIATEVRELSSWCREQNIAVDFEDLDVEVLTDSKWCRFIVRQLLTNAVKYSPKGGTIIIKAILSEKGHVMVTIKDEGPGIPSHDLPRIFDKGFTGGTGRLHNAATGLGLYLAQNVAEKIGILLTVDTKVERGTEMQMHFSVKNEFDKTVT